MIKRTIYSFSLMGLLAAGCLPKTSMVAFTSTETVQVVIDANDKQARVSSLIFGSNVQWENKGDGILKSLDDSGQVVFDEKLLEKTEDLKVTMLRYPGGSLADTYDWKKGIGPSKTRGENPSFGGVKEKTAFGLDEFMQLCRRLDCTPIYIVNFNMSPEEVKELVQYANAGVHTVQGKKRAGNGSEAPYDIQYWEVGNELYGAGEEGHTSAENYTRKYLEFYKTMKEADPGIQIGACFELAFQSAAWMEAVYPHILTWNRELAPRINDSLDFLSVHFYAPFDFKGDNRSMAKTVLAGPQVFEDDLSELQSLFKKKKPVFVTEYNVYYEAANFKKVATLQGGLFNASMLVAFIRNGIDGACHWSLANNGYFGLLRSKDFLVERPSYHVFKLMREHIYDTSLSIRSKTVPHYNVGAFGNVPKIDRVDQVDMLATLSQDGNTLGVIFINKSQEASVPVQISLEGFPLNSEVGVAEIASNNIWADNEVLELVKRVNSTINVSGSMITHTLKVNSVTAFNLRRP